MMTYDRKDLKKLWKDAQCAKIHFIKTVSDMELAWLKAHKMTKADVAFIWLDELLIGIEVRDGRKRRILYDNELETTPSHTHQWEEVQTDKEGKTALVVKHHCTFTGCTAVKAVTFRHDDEVVTE